MSQVDCKTFNKDIKNRASRLSGQIAGIGRMIDNGRNPEEILTQISAVKAGLSRLAIELLKDESRECMDKRTEQERLESFEKLVTNLFKTI